MRVPWFSKRKKCRRMNNVYAQVQAFYDEAPHLTPLSQECVDGFLRQLAWQGKNAAELMEQWQNVRRLLLYMMFADIVFFEDLRAVQISLAVEWLAVQEEEFKLKLSFVRPFLNTLRDLADYLEGKKFIDGAPGVREAAQRMVEGGRLHLLELPAVGFAEAKGLDIVEVVRRNQQQFGLAETAQRVADLLERAYTRMSGYFQNTVFQEDINRAVFLYGGESMLAPEEGPQRDAFWTSFWDFFLFDYHLLRNDRQPIRHFLIHNEANLSAEEAALLEDMAQSQFTVFYVQRVLDAETVECIDLLRGTAFNMPMPGFGLDWKGFLFLGHVRTGAASMANYVCHFTSYETSRALQRRIQTEVHRMQVWFSCQSGAGSMDDFLCRHAAAVRQLVMQMAHGERFQVLPELVEHEKPPVAAETEELSPVVEILKEVAPVFGLSHYDVQMLETMWRHYCAVQGRPRFRRPESWGGALLLAYGGINDLDHIQAGIASDFLDVSHTLLKKNYEQLCRSLELTAYDVRYLNEQGLVSVVSGEAWEQD